jgi:hypothetical protein
LSESFTWRIACVAAVLCCVGVAEIAAQSATPLKLAQTIALGGVEGRIDHFAFDTAGERLFVCALGNNTVEVVDLRNEFIRSPASAHRKESLTSLSSIVFLLRMTKAVFAKSTTQNHTRRLVK